MGLSPGAITQMLVDGRNGRQDALDELMPLVYDELRRLADIYLRRERPDHTLQATALVHEAYLRMVDQTQVRWQDRAQFFGLAASSMRRILVDHARRHRAEKRGGGEPKLSFDERLGGPDGQDMNLEALEDALQSLATLDPRKGRLVELRFFGGLTLEEVAEVLGISRATAIREWNSAKAWLYRELKG